MAEIEKSEDGKYRDFTEQSFISLKNSLNQPQIGSVIDLTIKNKPSRKPRPVSDKNELSFQSSSSTTETDLSSRNTVLSCDEEYDELPSKNIGYGLDDYDVPPIRMKESKHNDLGSDYDVPRSQYPTEFSDGSNEEYDYPRSSQYQCDVSL
jgi:hypothetical protein